MEVTRTFIARTQAVRRWGLTLFWASGHPGPEDFHPFDIAYGGMPLVNWIREDSLRLLREHPDTKDIQAEYALLGNHPFTIRGAIYGLTGIAYNLECAAGWVSQSVREDVTLGSYDFLRRRVTIPAQQAYILGPFDQSAWAECLAPPPPESEMEPGTFTLSLTLLTPVNGIAGFGVPDLEPLIKERSVSVHS